MNVKMKSKYIKTISLMISSLIAISVVACGRSSGKVSKDREYRRIDQDTFISVLEAEGYLIDEDANLFSSDKKAGVVSSCSAGKTNEDGQTCFLQYSLFRSSKEAKSWFNEIKTEYEKYKNQKSTISAEIGDNVIIFEGCEETLGVNEYVYYILTDDVVIFGAADLMYATDHRSSEKSKKQLEDALDALFDSDRKPKGNLKMAKNPRCAYTNQPGKLTMATNAFFPPYEYYEGGEIVGIDVEIAEAVAKKLGLELVVEDTEFNSIPDRVQMKKYDIGMAGMTATDERKQTVNFTSTYATSIQSVIVKEGSEIKDIDTLLSGNYKVGVQTGTTGDIYLSSPLEEGGVGEDRVIRYSKGSDAVLALTSGKIDAIVIDNKPAKFYVDATPALVILETPFAEEEYAICVNKDNAVLLDKINQTIKELKEDGTIPVIIEKYIPST